MSGLVLPPTIKGIGLSALGNRKPQTLLEAAQHNKRDPEGRGWRHKSNPKMIHLNQCLEGPGDSDGVVELQEAMMAGVGYAPKRHDYSQAFEVLFTAPADFSIDYSEYFAWCLAWIKRNLGQDIVLTADTHFDEGEPHLHILLVPIADGKWVGSGFATPKIWPKLQEQFGRDVGAAFGLKLTPQLKGKALIDAASAVRERLTELLTPHISGELLAAILRLAVRKPAGLIGPLGMTSGTGGDGGAAFKRIALSAGKGGKKERRSNPYGIEPNAYGIEIDQEKAIPYLCNGFAEAPPPDQHFDDVDQPLSDLPNADGEIAAPTRPAPALPIERDETLAPPPLLTRAFRPAPLPISTTDHPAQLEAPFVELTTRHRDCDQAPDRYDFTSGDFTPTKPPAPRLLRQAADGWVTAVLATKSQTPDARRH